MATSSNTTFEDIHSDIIQTHILPLLDGPSLSNTSYVSNNLQSICSDHHLWSRISKSTWPSIIDPRVDDVISTFPARHRSFYEDSYPSLVIDVSRDGTITQFDQVNLRKITQNEKHNLFEPDAFRKHHCFLQKLSLGRKIPWVSQDTPGSTLVPSLVTDVSHLNLPYSTSKKGTSLCYHMPNEIISAVDIRYENDIIYSTVKVTDTSSADFLSSGLKIELPGISRTIDLTVDEISGADKATLLHLKESLTLNWILIDPALKRAGNFSSIKPVSAKQDWATNETHVRYVTILPGRDSDEIVKCRIHLTLGVGKGGIGLHVKEVMLNLEDLHCNCLNGKDFLVTMQGAIMEENNVKRKVMVADDEENWKSYKVFKEMKKMRKEMVKQKQHKREVVTNLSYAMLLCYFISLYFVILLLR